MIGVGPVLVGQTLCPFIKRCKIGLALVDEQFIGIEKGYKDGTIPKDVICFVVAGPSKCPFGRAPPCATLESVVLPTWEKIPEVPE